MPPMLRVAPAIAAFALAACQQGEEVADPPPPAEVRPVIASSSDGTALPPPPPPPPPVQPGRDDLRDYRIDLPPSYVRDESVHGIDSKVEVWRSEAVEISTDFGIYSAAPDCGLFASDCSLSRTQVGGLDASIGRYTAPHPITDAQHPYVIFIHVPVGGQVDLNIYARCRTETACNAALSDILRGTRIRS